MVLQERSPATHGSSSGPGSLGSLSGTGPLVLVVRDRVTVPVTGRRLDESFVGPGFVRAAGLHVVA